MFQLLFGFRGRINRAKMWLLYFVVSFALVLPVNFAILDAVKGWKLLWTVSPLGIAASAAFCAWMLLVMVVMLAAIVKRFHDRDKSAWWLAYFFGMPVAFFTAAFLLIGWPPREVFPGAQIVMHLFFIAVWFNNLWYLLELLVFRGTKGENRFGPDPLANPG